MTNEELPLQPSLTPDYFIGHWGLVIAHSIQHSAYSVLSVPMW